MFSMETLQLFQQFLTNATIQVNDPDFENTVRIVAQAKRELAQAMEQVVMSNGHLTGDTMEGE